MTVQSARKSISWLWFVVGTSTLFLVAAQSIAGRFEPRTSEVWEWLLPNLMPTLMLVVSVFTFSPVRNAGVRKVSTPFVIAAVVMSIGYLLLVLSPFVLPPILGTGPMEVIGTTQLFIGPIQGIVSGILGVFFVRAGQLNPNERSPLEARSRL